MFWPGLFYKVLHQKILFVAIIILHFKFEVWWQHMCVYACVHVCVHACVHMCACTRVHACVHVCVHVHVCICARAHAHGLPIVHSWLSCI